AASTAHARTMSAAIERRYQRASSAVRIEPIICRPSRRYLSTLPFELELSEHRVAVAKLPRHIMLRESHPVLGSLSEVSGGRGDGAEDGIDQLGRPALRIGVGLHLGRHHITDPDRSFALREVEL